jgi:hypothetical protein
MTHETELEAVAAGMACACGRHYTDLCDLCVSLKASPPDRNVMTSQQEADALLAEYQANRRPRMTLFDWDMKVKPHLTYIEAGASMAARHARALMCKPDFPTLAQDELADARRVLENALASIASAEVAYQQKPVENNRAA